MANEDIQQALLAYHNLRITDAMSDYIAAHLEGDAPELPIIAGDARTGIPIHATIPLEQLRRIRAGAQS